MLGPFEAERQLVTLEGPEWVKCVTVAHFGRPDQMGLIFHKLLVTSYMSIVKPLMAPILLN